MGNKHKDQTFLTQSGITANIKRIVKDGVDLGTLEHQASRLLHVIGENYLHPVPQHAEHMKLKGCAAVYIYYREGTNTYDFVSQVSVGGVPEVMASQAITDLRGSLMTSYGRKRPTKRSGI